MKRAPGVAVSVLWNWGSFFLGLAAMFVLTPLMMDTLGQARFGIWNLVISFVSALELLEFGVRTALVRTVAERAATGDLRGLNAACSSALLFFGAVGLFIVLAGQAGALAIQSLFRLEPQDVDVARRIMQIYSLGQGLQFPLNAYTACLVGRQRYDVTNRFHMAATLARVGLTFLALTHGFGLLAVALIHSCSTVACFAGMALAARRLTPGFAPSPLRADRESFGQLRRFGGGVLVISLALRLLEASGPTLAGMLLSMRDVALLSVAMAFARYLGGFLDAGIRVMVPYLGAMSGEEDHGGRRRIDRAARVSLALTMIVSGIYASGVCLFGRAFLTLWLGPQMAEGVARLLPPMMALAYAGSVAACCLNIFLGLGRLGRLPLAHWADAACSIALSLALMPRLGLAGFPLAALAGLLCVRLPWCLLMLSRVLGRPFLRDAALRAAALAGVFAAAWAACARLIEAHPPSTYPEVLAGAAAYALAVAACTVPLIPGAPRWIAARARPVPAPVPVPAPAQAPARAAGDDQANGAP